MTRSRTLQTLWSAEAIGFADGLPITPNDNHHGNPAVAQVGRDLSSLK